MSLPPATASVAMEQPHPTTATTVVLELVSMFKSSRALVSLHCSIYHDDSAAYNNDNFTITVVLQTYNLLPKLS